MALKLSHFDTKTKQDIGIEQTLNNSLAEYLFPDTNFSIGIAYPEATIPDDLQEHNGMTLQFCAGKRMFFASNPNIRQQLYPNPSDGAAYPLPFTPCQSFHELRNVRILVVDDGTGNNGGVIANDDAKKLVGDCKGLIDKNFAVSNNINVRTFQFRLGIKPQRESPVMRIAKGTLAPAQLDKLGESFFPMDGNVRDGTLRSQVGYDMVLATSSFKGRKGEDAIQPGEYMLSVGLGIKTLATYREHSLGTQVLVNYPQAVQQEILPIIKQQAEKLALDQKTPIKLALRYVETYERRKKLLAQNLASGSYFAEDIDKKFYIFDNLNSGIDSEENKESDKDLFLYSLLKSDLNNYCQLIEHPKIIAGLRDFVRYVESIRSSIPESEKLQLAAAIHNVSHTRESGNYSATKRAGVAFAIFPDEVIAQLKQLQFSQIRIIGTQFNECAGMSFGDEKVAIKFENEINPRDSTKTARWVTVEGNKLGIIDVRSSHLLSGCEARASIISAPNTSVIVTSLKNPENKLQIDNINKYTFANHNWQGEQVSMNLDVRKTNNRKSPVVFATIRNQVLGVLNKESVDFLQKQLAFKGRRIQGLTITGTFNNAPYRYADIVIDPSSVKFPDIQVENETSNIATVLVINGMVEPKFQTKTEQMMCNMLKRAVSRAFVIAQRNCFV